MKGFRDGFRDVDECAEKISFLLEEYNCRFEIACEDARIILVDQDNSDFSDEYQKYISPPELTMSLSESHCTWYIGDQTEDDIWETDCGEAFVFEVDGPEQNNFKFCPFCGKPIIPEAT